MGSCTYSSMIRHACSDRGRERVFGREWVKEDMPDADCIVTLWEAATEKEVLARIK
jgi:hypothetical protein